jgi:FeS assembly SUF system regulator
MLRLSKLTDYGVVIMAHMARQERFFAAAELAAGIGLRLPTASKILKRLARGGLLQSARGAKGGYVLARQADQISIAQIIAAMEGPIGLTECIVRTGTCALEGTCALKDDWHTINRRICDVLEEISLADLTQPRLSKTVDATASE